MNENQFTYDQRQLNRMVSVLDRYEDGGIPLGRLISDLEALLFAMESRDTQFRSSFESEWGKLEVTRAVILFEERTNPNSDELSMISEAVKRLRKLITE